MKKPVLVIMAAGMGSRYGGLKQIDPVDDEGHKIIDFSVYDAKRAGFEKVIFIIKKENEQDFRTCVGDAMSKFIEVEYAFQDLNDVPESFEIPTGREKPWGTTHAVLACKDMIKEPFLVINADDYYGRSAFGTVYDFLMKDNETDPYLYAMVGFELGNTLTDYGSVARGCCETDASGYLKTVVERTQIEKRGDGAVYTEDGGESYHDISLATPVSMNMWAFSTSVLKELEILMERFFKEEVAANPLKSECLLPRDIDKLLKAGTVKVKVLPTKDRWFGVTYREDKPFVVESLAKLKAAGEYPVKLWGKS